MDRIIRRALYTVLVAGGLVVVGASPAYATVEDLSDSVVHGESDATESVAPDGDAAGLVDGRAGRHSILESLMRADVGAVVEGTLGEDGVLDDLLVGGPPTAIETPVPDGPQPQNPVPEDPVAEDPVSEDQPAADPAPDDSSSIIPGIIGPGREPTDKPGAGAPGSDRPGSDHQGSDRPAPDHQGAGRPGAGGQGSDRPVGTAEQAASGDGDGDGDGGRLSIAALSFSGPAVRGSGSDALGLDRLVGARAEATDRSAAADDDGADDVPATGVDLSWGGRADVVPTSADATADDLADPAYDGTILMSGLYDGIRGTTTGLDGQAATERSDATLAQTGPTITGYLALVSLLLGLGIAVLCTRRRTPVV